jgi:DNA-sulfur modification-associated
MEAGDHSPTLIRDVRPLRDMGHDVWDAIVTADQLYELHRTGKLAIDPERQRGKDSVTGAEVIKKAKVEQWTEDLLDNKWVCGQLSWNLRTEDCEVAVKDGDLAFEGQATIPDSGHRHRTIFRAFESIERGSSFEPSHPFSLRIWNVSKDLEGEIFYKMNQESDKADATRSKWLAQKTPAQRLARQVVRMSQHMTDRNVEAVRNSLSRKNPRLCAFNTISLGFEYAWEDVTESQIDEHCAWFLTYWDALVDVLPELRRLPLPERQRARETLVGSALAIQGYIRVGRVIYDREVNFDVLGKLNDKHIEPDGSQWDFFTIDNPLWQRIGVVSPSVNKKGETTLRTRNSHQTRRAMEAALLAHLDLGPEPEGGE